MNNQLALTIVNRSREIVANAHSQISERLAVPHPDNDSFTAGFRMLDQGRIKHTSWKNVGEMLGLNAAQIKNYVDLLRVLSGREAELGSDPLALNKCMIAGLQLVNLLELVQEAHPEFSWESVYPLPQEARDGNAVRQMRAIELLIREVVDEAWADQHKLISRMREILNDAVVDRIVKNAEKGNVLSGTLLEQLRLILADKEDFPGYYHRYFDPAPALNYASGTRETLSLFLQDLNHIRNKIAHHKRLSEAERLLLNEYFDQVIEPLRAAYREGRLKTDPDALYDAPAEAIERYQQQVEKQLAEIGDELKRTGQTVKEIREDTGILRRKSSWILAGIVGIAAITGATLHFSGGSFVNTEIIKDKVSDVQDKLGNVKQETSSDPRKELANMGVQWDQGEMEQAIRRGDLRTVQLFNEGGMSWHSNFLVAALDEWYTEGHNPGRAATIDYLSQHAGNLIYLNGYSGTCGYAMDTAIKHNKKGGGNTDLNNKVISTLCKTDIGLADFKVKRQKLSDELEKLKADYHHDTQPVEVCFRENMQDDGNRIYSNIHGSGASPSANYYVKPTADSRAASVTNYKFKEYQDDRMSVPRFKESLKYYCQQLAGFAKEMYPPEIAKTEEELKSVDDIAANSGLKG
ncbi:STY4199 family HEPN domain-containing protein [Pantoea coffeiphila]|uniref:STY4199-like HEPN domain-containing protein n=1 Tax=Pantoea coffeiphila TaxID=1465635 RepID=A0A2S9I7U4_9GAMM|nr:STY4199 family HEPN domain-containing protein [Pantoea coffeiphila]PRD13851.1 hypothetical protein CQW29_19090 [Pantoea coffeiphila]